jgi:1-acyl-sn-glycerol-3-phosphate acyltransferase
MLDLGRLERIRLTRRPRVQRVVAYGLLAPNYNLPPGVRITLEHADRVPREPVVFAMNHTDRYNYWPFQYRWWRDHDRFTATWVKGKYYEHPFVAKFMELTNNIPTVSRGYLMTKDFLQVMQRRPTDAEYQALKRLISGSKPQAPNEAKHAKEEGVPRAVLETPRDMLGRAFDPARESYAACLDALYRAMMRRFVELNAEAFEKDLDLLVFPQGTRSIRLSRGHGGIAQVALKFRKTVVPVGCSGSDHVYPGGSPVARPGRIVYRFGEPISYESMREFHIDEEFEPFTAAAEERHGAKFQGFVDQVMARIDELVDPDYRFGEASDGVQGSHRFV